MNRHFIRFITATPWQWFLIIFIFQRGACTNRDRQLCGSLSSNRLSWRWILLSRPFCAASARTTFLGCSTLLVLMQLEFMQRFVFKKYFSKVKLATKKKERTMSRDSWTSNRGCFKILDSFAYPKFLSRYSYNRRNFRNSFSLLNHNPAEGNRMMKGNNRSRTPTTVVFPRKISLVPY